MSGLVSIMILLSYFILLCILVLIQETPLAWITLVLATYTLGGVPVLAKQSVSDW